MSKSRKLFSDYLINAFRDSRGFTLTEILMVMILVSILVAVGVTQFTNFSNNARNNTLQSNLQILRNAIATHNGQMRVRCNVQTNAWPPLANLTANNITNAATPCTTTQVPNAADRLFVATGIPVNSWGAVGVNTIVQCTGTGCTNRATACVGGAARTGAADGWCYDVATGNIWANSSRNDGANSNTGNEHTY